MIPLNEYPKEELEVLLKCVNNVLTFEVSGNEHYKLMQWRNRIYTAISDQEFS